MANERELQRLPVSGDSSLVISETRSGLVARARRDAANLMPHESRLPEATMGQARLEIASEQYQLGLRYKKGDGVEKNLKEAARWFLKAANQDYPPAQFQLGFMYLHGSGIPTDYIQAAGLLRKAAESGGRVGPDELGVVMLAQLELAAMYSKGIGVARDSRKSGYWFRRSIATSSQISRHKQDKSTKLP